MSLSRKKHRSKVQRQHRKHRDDDMYLEELSLDDRGYYTREGGYYVTRDPIRYRALDQYEDPTPKHIPRTSSLPFRTAIKELDRQLDLAKEFYSDFRTDYDNDVAGIKPYVSFVVLEHVWALKVKGHEKIKRSERGNPQPLVEGKTRRFNEMEDRLLQALAASVEVPLETKKLGKRSNRLQAKRNLQRKIRTYSDSIEVFLRQSTKSRDCCDDLFDELCDLKELINPQSEKNKKLLTNAYDSETDSEDGEVYETS